MKDKRLIEARIAVKYLRFNNFLNYHRPVDGKIAIQT
jgi:hypothetical protein